MSPGMRRRLSLAVMVVAGVASLATSMPSPPSESRQDRFSLTGDGATESRQVPIRLVTGHMSAPSSVVASIRVERSVAESPEAVTVTVTRERDGAVVGEATDPRDRLHHQGRVTLYRFRAIDACAPETTCEETFLVTFAWATDDPDLALDLRWVLDATAQPESGSGSSDATLSVEIMDVPGRTDGP